MNHCLATYTGKLFDPFQPRVEDVCIEDIAHALANHCRFNGHCREFYSVAQHSVEMAIAAMLMNWHDTAKWCLFHDASEAYLPDICRPIKGGMGWMHLTDNDHLEPPFLPFDNVESRILHVVAAKFELPLPISPAVGEIDNRMLATEKRDLGFDKMQWPSLTAKPYSKRIFPMSPFTAKDSFLMMFDTLFGIKP